MKVAQGDPAHCRTNWRRFAVAVGVPTVVAGALVVGLANGAFAASLTLSGEAFKISADSLVAQGFVQYSQSYPYSGDSDKQLSLAVAGIKDATLTNLCQSVHLDGTPFSLVITAGKDPKHPAVAHNMVIGMTHMQGEAVFTGVEIGKDAATLSKGDDGDGSAKGAAGTFGQEADSVTITGLKQTAQYTEAGTFTLTGLDLSVDTDLGGHPKECF